MAVGVSNFPTALDTATELFTAVNEVRSILGTGGASAVVTTVPVVVTTNAPSSGSAVIVSTDGSLVEIVRYTGKTGSSITGCTRGAEGTTARAWIAGDTIYFDALTALHHNVLRDAIIATQTSLVPAGSMIQFVGAAAPTGWLLCNGQEVLRTSPLGLALSGAYGAGNGSTTYNVPDLRDRFPIGKGVNAANDALGETGGVRDVTLTSAQSGVPAHAHTVGTLATVAAGNHNHSFSDGTVVSMASGGQSVKGPNNFANITGDAGTHSHTISGSVASSTPADAASSHTNMPPFVTVNYIIKQ